VPSDQHWQPTATDDRYVTLDVLRGLALFGVLLITLPPLFRVSLFAQQLGTERSVSAKRLEQAWRKALASG